MFTSDHVRKRCRVVYDSQVARHRKKLQKSAGRGIKLEIPPDEVLPYNFNQFFDWVWYKYGTKGHRCPWCGRPIDFLSMTFDHRIPLDKEGSLGLDNLEGICKPCQDLKGSQMPEEYTELLRFLDTLSTSHRNYLEQRIRAGAAANRMRFFPHKKKDAEGAPSQSRPRVNQTKLNLSGDEPF